MFINKVIMLPMDLQEELEVQLYILSGWNLFHQMFLMFTIQTYILNKKVALYGWFLLKKKKKVKQINKNTRLLANRDGNFSPPCLG